MDYKSFVQKQNSYSVERSNFQDLFFYSLEINELIEREGYIYVDSIGRIHHRNEKSNLEIGEITSVFSLNMEDALKRQPYLKQRLKELKGKDFIKFSSDNRYNTYGIYPQIKFKPYFKDGFKANEQSLLKELMRLLEDVMSIYDSAFYCYTDKLIKRDLTFFQYVESKTLIWYSRMFESMLKSRLETFHKNDVGNRRKGQRQPTKKLDLSNIRLK